MGPLRLGFFMNYLDHRAISQSFMKKLKQGFCQTCNRNTYLTFHHLIPRKVHRRAHFRKNYSKQQLQAGIDLCRQCHSGIHKRFTEMELAKNLYTYELLSANEQLKEFFNWVSKQRLRTP